MSHNLINNEVHIILLVIIKYVIDRMNIIIRSSRFLFKNLENQKT